MFFGLLVIIVGVVFLMQNLGWLSANVWQVIWPVLIILLGISIMFREKKGYGWRRRSEDRKQDNGGSNNK